MSQLKNQSQLVSLMQQIDRLAGTKNVHLDEKLSCLHRIFNEVDKNDIPDKAFTVLSQRTRKNMIRSFICSYISLLNDKPESVQANEE